MALQVTMPRWVGYLVRLAGVFLVCVFLLASAVLVMVFPVLIFEDMNRGRYNLIDFFLVVLLVSAGILRMSSGILYLTISYKLHTLRKVWKSLLPLKEELPCLVPLIAFTLGTMQGRIALGVYLVWKTQVFLARWGYESLLGQ